MWPYQDWKDSTAGEASPEVIPKHKVLNSTGYGQISLKKIKCGLIYQNTAKSAKNLREKSIKQQINSLFRNEIKASNHDKRVRR